MKTDLTKLPFVLFCERELLPQYSGVYFAIDADDNVLYVGKAIHLRNRWRYHHRLERLKSMGCHRITWIRSSKEECGTLESEMIYSFDPPLNGDRKQQSRAQYNRPDSVVFAEVEAIYDKFKKYYTQVSERC